MTPSEAPELQGWLLAEQAADLLGLSRQHLSKMAKDGKFDKLATIGTLPFVLIAEDEVLAMVEARKEREGAAA